MKRFLLGLLTLGFASIAQGQVVSIFDGFDLDTNTFVYCDTTAIPAGMSACTTGAAVGDGWLTVGRDSRKVFGLFIDQLLVVGGIIGQLEGRMLKADGTYTSVAILVTLLAKTLTTQNQVILVPEGFEQVRFGIRIGTNDDGGDATTELVDVIYNNR